jgi:hypothetical protein
MSQPPFVPQVNSQSPPANVDALVVSFTHRGTLYVPGESGTNGQNGSDLPFGDIRADHLPTLQLADGNQEAPIPGKPLFKQKTTYLRNWDSIKLEPVVRRSVMVHSKLTHDMFRRMCQGKSTPEQILKECRSITTSGRRNGLATGVSDASMCSTVHVNSQPATAHILVTPASAPPVLLQEASYCRRRLIILQEASIVLSAWKEARGEGGMSEQLTDALGDAIEQQHESEYVYGDKVTFTKMLKDSAMVRMVSQRVADRCVVLCFCIRKAFLASAVVSLWPESGMLSRNLLSLVSI